MKIQYRLSVLILLVSLATSKHRFEIEFKGHSQESQSIQGEVFPTLLAQSKSLKYDLDVISSTLDKQPLYERTYFNFQLFKQGRQ